ncbi:DUF4215 domain-containing protein [Archangium lansingense]|uniref:DUF4215 domain-containing protein n=1 Tax=Archangium lansingense TaxID=2995310 RepID=UPI003B763888
MNAAAAVCGDGQRTTPEECDDGNTDSGDGCSRRCWVENGYSCTDANFSLAYKERWDVDEADAPLWRLSEDRLTVQQTTNSDPAVYMTNLPAAGATIRFELEVQTESDDDFIGWVVGFQQGDTTNPDAEFMLFDWKQKDQGAGVVGLAMSRVKGVVNLSAGLDHFFGHTGAIHEEARATNLGDKPWADNTTYEVKMTYEPTHIRVWINDVLEFDVSGTFPVGKFGFYNCSQAQGRFTLIPGADSICGLDPHAKPNEPPVALCRDVTVSADPLTCLATGSVNAGSYDPDRRPEPLQVSESPQGPFGPGSHAVKLVASDGMDSATCTGTVTVVDTTPPVPGADKGLTLWPPNHHYVKVNLSDCAEDAQDACSGTLPVDQYGRITHVTSDEVEDGLGNGDGHTCNDIVLTSASSVQLRSERSGTKDGRVYTVHYLVSDQAGNAAPGSCTVRVPHDQSGRPAKDSGPAFCAGAGCPGGLGRSMLCVK